MLSKRSQREGLGRPEHHVLENVILRWDHQRCGFTDYQVLAGLRAIREPCSLDVSKEAGAASLICTTVQGPPLWQRSECANTAG